MKTIKFQFECVEKSEKLFFSRITRIWLWTAHMAKLRARDRSNNKWINTTKCIWIVIDDSGDHTASAIRVRTSKKKISTLYMQCVTERSQTPLNVCVYLCIHIHTLIWLKFDCILVFSFIYLYIVQNPEQIIDIIDAVCRQQQQHKDIRNIALWIAYAVARQRKKIESGKREEKKYSAPLSRRTE